MSPGLTDPAEFEFPRHWYPVAITETDKSPLISWRFLGDQRFTMPFFDGTLVSIPNEPRYCCCTPPEALSQFGGSDYLEPTAFIFHASRCGSTLVAQMLATLSQCIVISEAPVIDSAVSLCRLDARRDQGLEILKGVVRALGQRRTDSERHLFVKFDSWHITHLPLIRKAFPDTPCFFIYRHPAEILDSHRRVRGSQMVPGLLDPAALGLDAVVADPADLDGYCLRVLASFFRSAKLHTEAGDLRLINYSQLPAVIWTDFLPLLSIPLQATELQRIKDRSSRHSKRPSELIAIDTDQATSETPGVALAPLNTFYEDMERIRWIPNAGGDRT